MNRLLTSLFALCLAVAASAQKATVAGSIVDSDGEPLPGATVVIMRLDSTQVTGQSTKDDGSFSISGFQVGDYLLRASYIGYKTAWRSLNLSKQNRRIVLGQIVLMDNAKLMKA